MYTLSILCCFLSSWSLYATAKRVEFQKKGLTLWFANHVLASRLLSVVLFFVSTLLFLTTMGITVSILAGSCLWMLITSLITLFAPFHRVKGIYLGLILIASAAIEFLSCTL